MRTSTTTDKPLPLHWRLVEAAFHAVYRIQVLDDDPEALLAYNLFRYTGPPLQLGCGTRVERGDLVAELHFRREALSPLSAGGDPRRAALALLQLGDRDVPRLARKLREELTEVKALHAVTLFHRGIGRYGFEIRPLESRCAEQWLTAWQRLLMLRDRGPGAGRQRAGELPVARHVWVSRKTLIQRYGSAAESRTSPAGEGPCR
ncbi:MAG: YkoP family protein [Armatimonadota bacterium]